MIAGAMSLAIFLNYLLLHLFLGMGTLAVYRGGEGPLAQVFWGGVGVWFWPVVRLAIYSLPLLALVPATLFAANWLFDFYSTPFQTKAAVFVGIGASGLFLYARIMDYARIYAMTRQDRCMIRACWAGTIFVLRRLFPVCLLSLFYSGLAAAIGYGFLELEGFISLQQTLLLSLGLGQLHMFFRFALKLSLLGGELNYFNQLHGQQVNEAHTQPPVRRRPTIWESDLKLENDDSAIPKPGAEKAPRKEPQALIE